MSAAPSKPLVSHVDLPLKELSSMSLYERVNSHGECVEPVLANEIPQHLFFRLPYELRQMILWWTIELSRKPSPKLVHETNLRVAWKDHPSPLLSTSRQIRAEVKDLLRHHRLFTLRVTTFGVAFDMISLTCFISQSYASQGLPKSYVGLHGLFIEIWPPHSHGCRERVEMLYLHEHLRTLRDQLPAGPQISQLYICFQENKPEDWVEHGKPRSSLIYYDWKGRNNIEFLLDHLAYITNADKVSIQLLSALPLDRTMEAYTRLACELMEEEFLEDDVDIYADFDDASWEHPLGRDTLQLKETFLNELADYRMNDFIDYAWLYRTWYGDLREIHGHRTHLIDFIDLHTYHVRNWSNKTIDTYIHDIIEAKGFVGPGGLLDLISETLAISNSHRIHEADVSEVFDR